MGCTLRRGRCSSSFHQFAHASRLAFLHERLLAALDDLHPLLPLLAAVLRPLLLLAEKFLQSQVLVLMLQDDAHVPFREFPLRLPSELRLPAELSFRLRSNLEHLLLAQGFGFLPRTILLVLALAPAALLDEQLLVMLLGNGMESRLGL